MKKVLLLGDSIRQNYEYVVKENLADQADVIFTNDNNRFSVFMLRYLGEWIDALTESKPETIDIIHFNCGCCFCNKECVKFIHGGKYYPFCNRCKSDLFQFKNLFSILKK